MNDASLEWYFTLKLQRGEMVPNLKYDSRFVFCAPEKPHIPDFNNLTANLNCGSLELHLIPQRGTEDLEVSVFTKREVEAIVCNS